MNSLLSKPQWVIALAAFLMFLRLGATTVFQVAEGRNAQCAAEMLAGDKIVPLFNQQLRTDKPPLHYYAMMVCYQLAGKTPGASRFFSAIMGLCVVAATWLFTKKHVSVSAAALATGVLLSSLHFIFQSRLATPDPFLIAAHVLALFCFWEGWQTQKTGWFFFMYGLLGMAFLAKGPVGLILPAATIFFYLVTTKQFNGGVFRKIHFLPGLLLFASLALPWFWLVDQKTNGAFTRGFFLEHNLGRFNEAVDKHQGPFILTIGFVLLGLFPFGVFIPRAGYQIFKARRINPLGWFLLLAALLIIVPYSISSTKLINYTSPSYPFLAILIALVLDQSPLRRSYQIEIIMLLFITLLFPVGYLFWVKNDGLLNMNGYAWMVVSLPIGVAVAAGQFFKKRLPNWWQPIVLGAIFFNTCFFAFILPALDKNGSVYRLKPLIAQSAEIAGYNRINDAFVFYAPNSIPLFHRADSVQQWLRRHPKSLVLQLAKAPHLTDSIPGLKVTQDQKDLFSGQHSFIYQLQQPLP